MKPVYQTNNTQFVICAYCMMHFQHQSDQLVAEEKLMLRRYGILPMIARPIILHLGMREYRPTLCANLDYSIRLQHGLTRLIL
jgi:hypothetical protein